jgi:Ca-activated chloride channel homolog
MKRRLFQDRVLRLSFLLAFASSVVGGQASAQARFSLSRAEALKVNVDLVTLSFSVKDNSKHYIKNLSKEDVVLLEDGVSQDIVFFDSENAPLSLVVLVDVSESTEPLSKEVGAASRVIVDLLRSEDEAAVIAFSDVPTVLQEFTQSRNEVFAALQAACEQFSGATNINDAVYLAAKKLNLRETDRRKVILLISDGKGNRGERERALNELRISEATFVGIGLGMKSRLFRGAVTLSQWVKATGGSLLLYSSASALTKDVNAALQQVRSQYAVAYVSSNKNRDGRFRRLRIELSGNSLLSPRCAIIQNLAGYFAPQESVPRP